MAQPKDKRVRANLRRLEASKKEALQSRARTDLLLPSNLGLMETETETERTYKTSQKDILEASDVSLSRKAINLNLEHGPYNFDFSRNGRSLLLCGHDGHVASMDWQYGVLGCELHLGETAYAAKHLHNDQFFAVAQKKHVFVYDKTGTELHRLLQHVEARMLDFLPYHFLLVSAGNTGMIKYHDVLTGQLVSELRTKMGPTRLLTQNPWNAVIHAGHGNGQVTLWSPAMPKPLAQVLACRGPVTSVSVDRGGKLMAAAGLDKVVRIWDIRMFKELGHVKSPSPASLVSFSDTGLLSVSAGPHLHIYKDVGKTNELYMHHINAGLRIEMAKFVPFEDLLGVGHAKGFRNLAVPGAGEANFDSMEVNPFELAKQRQETEVRGLLNKLDADMITLDPHVIGTIEKKAPTVRLSAAERAELERKTGVKEDIPIRPKLKAKNSKLRSYLRKKSKNVIDERRMRVEANLKREKDLRKKIKEGRSTVDEEDGLERFR